MPSATANSLVTVSPPPPGWSGDLVALFALLQTSLKVTNPVGYNSFATGGVAPTSDQGPWLKGGLEWFVWDASAGKYVPQKLTEGIPLLIGSGTSLPTSASASGIFFLEIPNVGIGLYKWLNGAWAFVSGTFSGPTALRPASPPKFTKYFDTEIGVELYYKTGFGWVTTDGVKGDIKFVKSFTLPDALKLNPGWALDLTMRGRVPAGAFGEMNGYTTRVPHDEVGSETHTLTVNEMPKHSHTVSGKTYRISINDITGGVLPPAQAAEFPDFTYTTSEAGGNGAHNNIQPTKYLICLVKEQ